MYGRSEKTCVFCGNMVSNEGFCSEFINNINSVLMSPFSIHKFHIAEILRDGSTVYRFVQNLGPEISIM